MKRDLKVVLVTLLVALMTLQTGTVLGQKKNESKPLTWNFADTDIAKVIEAVAEFTGKNFDIDPKVQGKVNLVMTTDVPPELAYEILEAILASRGFALVPVVGGNLVRVIPAPDAVTAPIPTTVGKAAPGEAYENLITQVLPVQFAQATDLGAVLDQLKSQVGRIQAYAPANLLIITDRASQVKRLADIVDTIDVPGFEEQWEIIPLKYQSADLLAQEILEVLSEEASALAAGQRTAAPAAPVPRPRTIVRRTPEAAEIVGAPRTALRIIADTWTNSLIVVAIESMMVKVKTLIAQLDVPTAFEEGNVHVYEVKNADVEEIQSALGELVSTGGAAAARQPGQPPAASGQVEAFEKEVRISIFKPTNRLIITASPRDWTVIQGLLEQLDMPERQVYVEAVIMEVTISDDVTVGVDLAAIDEDDFIAASTYGDLANLLIQGPLGFTGGLAGVVDGDMAITDPLTGETIVVPKIPALLTAIQTVTDLDILAAPALVTTDNTEAEIHVGQDVPFISGSARPLAQEAISPTIYSSVNREKVGITLTVEPQISEGDYVKLKVQVTVSDTIASDVGIDPNIAGPTLSVAEVTNTAIIRDGYMGIIGGLIRQKKSQSRSQVPILGDIPILGWFFGKRGTVNEKRNLVVILTPHIVRESEDLDALTRKHQEEYEQGKWQMRQELNFWRRAFKKEKLDKR